MPENRFLKIIKNPYKIFRILALKGCFKWMDDRQFLKLMYPAYTGEKLNLDNPKKLNEKIQWLKLYDRNPIYTTMVDKYEAKGYFSDIIGEQYIIPTLGVWDKFEDIDFDSLPDQFVLKCTHDSGGLVICKNKKEFNYLNAKKKIEKSLKTNYYWFWREWPYKNVKPRIIAEPYLHNSIESPLVDYKFYCYGGKPRYFMHSIGEAEHKVKNHKFNMQFESVDYLFKNNPTINASDIQLPDNIKEMVQIVEKLCADFQHVRVDLYNIDGKIYFGEFTLYTNGGYISIYNKEYSDTLADMIDISKVKG